MNIYITRHGQTQWNLEKRLQGWNNSNLTEKGIRDAEGLSEKLKDVEFDFVYASPQERALDTAKIIVGDDASKIEVLDGLKEIGFGSWEGMSIDRIKEEYRREYDNYLNKPHLYETIDGESFKDIFARVEEALKKIIARGGKNVLVVSHGVTIKVLTSIIKNIPLEELYVIPIHRGTALNLCKVDGDEINFLIEGDTSHIAYE